MIGESDFRALSILVSVVRRFDVLNAINHQGEDHALRRRFRSARSEKESGGLSPHGAACGESLARAWRHRVHRMRRGRRTGRQDHLFPSGGKLKPDEVVVFSWIVYKSRAQRDRVNKKAMADLRIADMNPKSMPFDGKRMFWGGFKTIVEM
jgi:Protein of unknown function (DUF1428)